MKLLKRANGLKYRLGQTIDLKSFILAVATLCLSVSIAQAAPPELKRLKYFEGNWICQDIDDPEPLKYTWNVKLDSNNLQYLGNVKIIHTDGSSQPIDRQEFFGYDSAAGKLRKKIVINADNVDLSYNLTADDWQGSYLFWQGVANAKNESIDKSSYWGQFIEKASFSRFTIINAFRPRKDNNWIVVTEGYCDRQT